ncbi:hypothetical protein M758_6G161500 [Ceratodon purpureus]|uniref:Uncharacterized protein n=1 Tax=Ceratodon purpureus TaxID=3225 RepID=A0A8T0HFW2_CERPU|nr:hypothetical protein KC19_6G167900 [Ceratodon purpureus]KAG0614239.1 hypothetical protein M758_6G161500 [Ceratodon purpureus]
MLGVLLFSLALLSRETVCLDSSASCLMLIPFRARILSQFVIVLF